MTDRAQVESTSVQTAETEFGKYATPLVHEAITQASTLDADPDAEVLHKLRVALRRLRTLLWAYRPMLDKDFDNQQRAIYKFLASAAGDTRDWDILMELLTELGEPKLAGALQQSRDAALKTSRETLSHASIKNVLHDAVSEANKELNTAPQRTPLKKFACKRVAAAEEQLRKRMKRASRAKRSDYALFHGVRKAGKKVRYLLEFFEPLLEKKQRKGMKKLKLLQKRFGALNDVVASRELLQSNLGSIPDEKTARRAIQSLKKEKKRRAKAAAKML
ncbi:CHAD domain-containing protein [Caballeronia arationis]|jgi:CHAD domain-containing protein|uniref:CHAD domain-containing protein n=1 Tax=Caballeronia arationis TaxID=1777142 RepID=UPI00074B9A5B|nr:CHAD domain-containing protein [Caballeronia arationis]SAL06234.1 CHAD domain-containing protein [Caballeronia arationis]